MRIIEMLKAKAEQEYQRVFLLGFGDDMLLTIMSIS